MFLFHFSFCFALSFNKEQLGLQPEPTYKNHTKQAKHLYFDVYNCTGCDDCDVFTLDGIPNNTTSRILGNANIEDQIGRLALGSGLELCTF